MATDDHRAWWAGPLDDAGAARARARWAASGAMALTGDADGPALVPPVGIVHRIERLGARVGADALALLGERAAIAGLRRQGARSCGGATRLLEAADGWVAVSLARPDDVDLVPAWLGLGGPPDDTWAAVRAGVAGAAAADVVERGQVLGLPLGRVGETSAGGPPGAGAAVLDGEGAAPGDPVVRRRTGDAPELTAPPLVVDLSSLWAGPLCAHLLGLHGARVVKVESTRRPDGARRGPAGFFDLLHSAQRAAAFDLSAGTGVDALRRLLAAADIVIEGSRPRALEHLGIDAHAVVASGPRVWVSITGHGRSGAGRDRVAFGDDAAAAGGLVAWAHDGRPRFVADAVADPLTGVAAAAAVLDALAAGGRWVIDVAMSRVAAAVAGPDVGCGWSAGDPGEARPPVARQPHGRAPGLGADTDAVRAELGLRPPGARG